MIRFVNNCDGCQNDSLDVRFTKACDNDCAFCVEKTGVPGRCMNVERLIENTIASGKGTVLVLGGEPLLYPRELFSYLKGIRPYVREIYVTTSLPMQSFTEGNYPLFQEMMELMDGLNVSLQHYKWKRNNSILRASSKHNRIKLLKDRILKDYAKKVRVSINLTRGGIDSKKKLIKFLRKMEKIGVKHVKINELQNVPELYVSYEDVCKEKLPSPYAHGCQTEIKIKGISMKITLKRSCFMVEKSRKATKSDLQKAIYKQKTGTFQAFQTVAYEDGTLENGWLFEN